MRRRTIKAMADTEKTWRMHWTTRLKTNDAMWNRCENMLGRVYSFGGVNVFLLSLQCSALKHKRTGRISLRIDATFHETDDTAESPLKFDLRALDRMAK